MLVLLAEAHRSVLAVWSHCADLDVAAVVAARLPAIVLAVVVDMEGDFGVVNTLGKDSPSFVKPFEVLVVGTFVLAGQQCLTVALAKYVLDE